MLALRERLQADAASLTAFAALNSQHLAVKHRAPDLRSFVVEAHMDAPVAEGDGYRVVPEHRLSIEVPDNYLSRDASGLFVKSRIRREGARLFHPNVWPSDGYCCYDSQFHPAKSLAEQLHSVLEIMQCRAVNHDSPANWDADYYFLKNAPQVQAGIRPVRFRLPAGCVRLQVRPLPRLR
jgi:hypothetical protein